jgi:PAS domain S-box-containing protein
MLSKEKTYGELVEEINDLRFKMNELKDRHMKFSQVSTEGIVILEGHLIREVNRAAYTILGYEKEELIGKTGASLIHPEDLKSIVLTTMYKDENKYELRVVTKTGSNIYCEVKTQTISYQGLNARVIVFRDVSVRRRAVELAKESEERFRRLSEASFEAVLIHENGNIIDFNETCCKLLGYTPSEMSEMSAFDLATKEDHDFLRQQMESGFQKPYETTGVKKDGTKFFAELNVKEYNYKGTRARVVAIRDISERKEYERQLQQVNDDYESLIRQSPDGIFILDEKGKILFANPSAHNILGISSQREIKDRYIFEFILPGQYKQILESGFLLKDGYDLPFAKLNAIRVDGKFVKIEYKPVNINYQGKKAILVVYHDIDFQEQLTREKTRYKVSEEMNRALKIEIVERKKIEKKLNTSHEQYKEQSAKLNSIIESSSHMVWTVNNKAELTSFNENFTKYIQDSFGSRPSLFTRMNVGKYVSSKEYNDYWNKKVKAAFEGKSQHFETNLKNKKGVTIWKEIYLNPIFDENKVVKEVSGIGHDITEKKLAEEKINQSLKEKEVLLKEVHHRVKNNLQVISSILNLQSSYVVDQKTIDLLKESQNRIKSMSFIHESLYQTKDFTSVNFSEYVKNIASNLMLSYVPEGKKIKLKQKMDHVFLNLDLAIPCGLIINELMSNALKYAFVKGNKGEIVIIIEVNKKENVRLIISDNGPGLPKGLDYRNTQSLGLQLVVVLVSQLHGTIRLQNQNGAKYTINFSKFNKNK